MEVLKPLTARFSYVTLDCFSIILLMVESEN